MTPRKRRVVVGDVFSLAVVGGWAHLQAIGVHPRHRQQWVVRVFSDIRKTQSTDAAAIAAGPQSYTVLVGDLGYAEKLGQVNYVGYAEVPEQILNRNSTIRGNNCRSGHPLRQESWWLDDGLKEWKVGKLTEEQQEFTDGTFIPPIALAENIGRGWDPNWEFKGPGAREFQSELRVETRTEQPRPTFFLIFTDSSAVENARAAIENDYPDAKVEIDEVEELTGEDDEGINSYGLAVSLPPERCTNVEQVFAFDKRFTAIARKYKGTYDGNEIPISGSS